MSNWDFVTPIWRQRELLADLIRRDIAGRYNGSALGLLWSLVNPLLMLAIYTFVFSVVFKARWGAGEEGRAAFAINLYAGMIVHGLLGECINRSPQLILQNANYVKRVVFPLELLSVMAVGSALFHSLVGLAVLLGFLLIVNGSLPWTALLVLPVWCHLILFALSLSWLLAALGVYLRDIGQLTGSLTTVLLFLSPVFYPATALPEAFRPLLYANPLTFGIEQTRAVLIQGLVPNWGELAVATLLSGLLAGLAFGWFQKARRGFADVL